MALGRVVGAASFLLDIETGTFNAKASEAERVWASTTANMSEHTLKVNNAQLRLRETLAKYPNDVQRVNRATIALMQAQREATAATVSHTQAVQKQASVSRGLGGAIRFASTALIGGYGLLYGLKATLKAAQEHQVVMGQLRVAVRDAGLSYREQAAGIRVALKAREDLGFTEESTVRSYITLVRATKDVTKATELQGVAANIARARNVPLEQATNAVAKAVAGQGTALKRLIPGLDNTAKGYALVTDAARRTAGAAAVYATSAAGAQARFDVALHRTSVTIGTALLPTVTQYLTKGANWLDQGKNQARVQRDVREAVHAGTEAIHGLTVGVHLLTPGIKSVIGVLGGFQHATELAFGVYLLRKLTAARRGVNALLTDLKLIGPATVASTAEADTALAGMTAAERKAAANAPRGGGGGGGGFTKRAGQALAAAFLYPYEREFFKEAFGVDAGGNLSGAADFSGRKPGDVVTDTSGARLIVGPDGKLYSPAQLRAKARERAKHDAPRDTSMVALARAQAAGAKSGKALIPRSITDALNAAALTPGTADDLRAAQAEEGYLRAQLARTKKGTQLYSDILAALVSAHSQTQGVLSQMAGVQRKGVSARAKAARERAQDIREKQRAYVQAQKDTATELKLEVENAKLGVEKAGKDLRLRALETYYLDRALKSEIAFDEAQSKNMRLRRSERERFALDAARLRREDARLGRGGKKGSGSFDAERFFLEQQSSFFGSYNSNDFTQSTSGGRTRRTPGAKDAATVIFNNHQHFNRETPDRHREARLAYNAYRAQFDG